MGLRFTSLEFASTEAREAVTQRVAAAGKTVAVMQDIVAVHDPWRNVFLLHVGVISDPAQALLISEAASSVS